MSTTPIEELAKKLADAVPDGIRTMRADLEDSFRSVLQTGLDKLDLVTREDFEVQEAVLQRTREKLEALEKQHYELSLELIKARSEAGEQEVSGVETTFALRPIQSRMRFRYRFGGPRRQRASRDK